MKIRTRLTVWYAGVLFASLLAMSGAAYFEIARARSAVLRRAGVPEHLIAKDQQEDFEDVSGILLGCGLPAAALAVAGGWWLMRKTLAPVSALTQAAAQVHDRNLSAQIPRSGNGDELDRLTEVFNAMTARLDGSFQRIREFTLHASHELKTPLTILRGELETALHDEHATAEQKDRLASQIDEIERLAKIVDGLTLLTKADAGQVALKCEPVRLDELVRESVADAHILAQPHNIEVRLDQCEAMTINGDRHRLRQLLLNLTDNAVKYNRPGGTVTFALHRHGASAALHIANTGAGLAPDLQARVFERFFRGDASHSNIVDGCGLGLSIAQWIVTAHRGQIQFSSEPDKLTTVAVKLPLV